MEKPSDITESNLSPSTAKATTNHVPVLHPHVSWNISRDGNSTTFPGFCRLLLSYCHVRIILWSWVISSRPGNLSSAPADLQSIFSLVGSESVFSLYLLYFLLFPTRVFVLSLPTLFPTSFAIIPLGNDFRLRLQAPFFQNTAGFPYRMALADEL